MNRPEIVAELSGNHEGSLERAIELMDLAVSCGADAVKIQTYTEDSLTLDSTRPEFQITTGLWKGQSLYELYRKAKTPREWMKPLFAHARENHIALFSSPFSLQDVEVLEQAGCPRYKIASYELVDLELIAACARTGKPMVMSTGMASLEEVDRAVACARHSGCKELTLLCCQSQYPADPRGFNLRTIPFFKQRYGCRAGLSNHALGNTLDVAATALGADLIEKHFTDHRERGSVDGAFSMEPAELTELRRCTEIAAASLGETTLTLGAADEKSRAGRRSIYLITDLKAGEVLSAAHVRSVRPAMGLEPWRLKELLGHRARRDLHAPLPLSAADFD